MSLTIRSMAPAEISLALDWAAAEGWNPGLADAECFAAADPAGFLLGEIAGEAVGCISATRYGTDFGFIGFYIMRPGFRGMGHGMALWRAAMARLEGRVIGLDGVVAQQANYQKSGFALLHRNIRYGAGRLFAAMAGRAGAYWSCPARQERTAGLGCAAALPRRFKNWSTFRGNTRSGA